MFCHRFDQRGSFVIRDLIYLRLQINGFIAVSGRLIRREFCFGAIGDLQSEWRALWCKGFEIPLTNDDFRLGVVVFTDSVLRIRACNDQWFTQRGAIRVLCERCALETGLTLGLGAGA